MFSTIKRKGQKRHLVSISIILILVGSSIVSSINFPVIAYAQNDTSNVSSDDSNPGVEDENTNRGSSEESNQPSLPEEGGNNFQSIGGQNLSPIANAGPDLEVDESSNVVLDGSASADQDGLVSSYSWQQTDGLPTIELNDADSAHPSFIAPDVDSNRQLTFQLIVTDNNGAADTDSVNVLIKDIASLEVPIPPADENQQTQETNSEGNGKMEVGNQPPAEICDNGIDDDGDGKIDSADEECTPSRQGPTPTPQPENNSPTSKDQQVTGEASKPLTITLQADDFDPGDELTATIVSEPQHGSLGDVDQNTGEISYTPFPNFAGDDKLHLQGY